MHKEAYEPTVANRIWELTSAEVCWVGAPAREHAFSSAPSASWKPVSPSLPSGGAWYSGKCHSEEVVGAAVTYDTPPQWEHRSES